MLSAINNCSSLKTARKLTAIMKSGHFVVYIVFHNRVILRKIIVQNKETCIQRLSFPYLLAKNLNNHLLLVYKSRYL